MHNEDVKVRDYINRKTGKLDEYTKNYNKHLQEQQDKLDDLMKEKTDEIAEKIDDIKKLTNNIDPTKSQIVNQKQIMNVKNNLINTRIAMLEDVRRKNSTRKKLIYTTISLIIIVIIIMMIAYVYSNKRYYIRDFNKNVALK